MGKINRDILKRQLNGALDSREARDAAFREANRRFKSEVIKLAEEYDNHPVTQEIKSGPDASNRTMTLGGRGNLFTFIGFDEGRGDPTEPVKRMMLTSSTLHRTRPLIRKMSKGSAEFIFRASIPSKDDLSIVSRMPWESGRSWVFAIESGISGLSHYIYKKFIKGSRSGKAIQTDKKYITGIVYKPVSYMSSLLSKFRSRISL